MEYYFDNERPIYLQLVELLKVEIVSGRLKSGEKLPSVRDFAAEAKVNPNTMQRALAELEREGLIFTERTNGKYVTRDESLIASQRRTLAESVAEDFLRRMERLGIDPAAAVEYISE